MNGREVLLPAEPTSTLQLEKCWTVQEVAKSWNLSTDTVTRIFRNEPGVLRIRRASGLRRRAYETLRIPDNVLRRVTKKYSVATFPV